MSDPDDDLYRADLDAKQVDGSATVPKQIKKGSTHATAAAAKKKRATPGNKDALMNKLKNLMKTDDAGAADEDLQYSP
eukprot:12400217-Karenia_brevis.AAC.1